MRPGPKVDRRQAGGPELRLCRPPGALSPQTASRPAFAGGRLDQSTPKGGSDRTVATEISGLGCLKIVDTFGALS